MVSDVMKSNTVLLIMPNICDVVPEGNDTELVIM
jgi:hypothetical protein